MTRRTVDGVVAAIIVGLVGFGLRRAGYDTLYVLLTTMTVVAVGIRLYRGLAESKNRAGTRACRRSDDAAVSSRYTVGVK